MGKLKKNKLKTHKATAKKLQVRNSGSVKFKKPGTNHITSGYPTKRLRRLRKGSELSTSDNKRLKRLIDRMN